MKQLDLKPLGSLHHPDRFWRSIVERPDSNEPRLRYAAWLDERREPLGEFIRVQCELGQAARAGQIAWACERREQELLSSFEDHWLGALPEWADWWSFRRGFVAEAGMSARQFARRADATFCYAPLEELHLGDAADALPELVRCVELRRIRHLDISNNFIRDTGARLLADCPHLDRLRSLNLSSAALGNAGVIALAASPHLTELRELYLSDNRLGATGALALAESPLAVRLRVLHLRFNDLAPATVAALRRAFGDRLQL